MAPIIKNLSSAQEEDARANFIELFKKCPIPESELLTHIALFLKRQDLSKILFLNEMYKQILNIPGVVLEFGTRWGRNLVSLINLRGIYEPYNHTRKIIF